MKVLIAGIVTVFVIIMVVVWVVSERADPRMLAQPAEFAAPVLNEPNEQVEVEP